MPFNPSPTQFDALRGDWESTTKAVVETEADAAEAMKHFRYTGDDSLLWGSLAARSAAQDRMRRLIQRIWNLV